ncbi:AAA family ATPase [Candidatus Dependentiae bacterium]|nr:AAA family ATPase [Candidatus Dependentiae bacterium]
MEIPIIGSHKLGKTTLFNAIRASPPIVPNFHFMEEIALNEIVDADTFFKYMEVQERILDIHLRRSKWAKKEGVNIISDRCLIDNLAYMIISKYSPYLYAFSRTYDSTLKVLEELSPTVREAISHLHDYDLVFYVPIEFKYGSPSKEEMLYQENVDDVIKRILKVYEIKHYVVKGSVEERRDFVIETIKQHSGEL